MLKHALLARRPIGLLLIGFFLSVTAVPLQMESETKMARREDYGPSPAELLARLLADRDGFTDNSSPLEGNRRQAASDSFSSVYPSSFSFGHGSIPSRRTNFWRNGEVRNFETEELPRFTKRNIDEIDRTAFDSFFKRNFDEIDRVGWTGFLKRLDYLPQNPRRV